MSLVEHAEIKEQDIDGRTYRVLNHYRIISKLGTGQFGKVLLGEDISAASPVLDTPRSLTNPKLVAIKSVNRIDKRQLFYSHSKGVDTTTPEKIRREIEIMVKCGQNHVRHPNIINLLQVVDDPKMPKIYMVLDYCSNGELKWTPAHRATIAPKDDLITQVLKIHKVTKDLLQGIEYLHGLNIIHRDIKPSNLLIDVHGNVKIGDFGVSLLLKNENESNSAAPDKRALLREIFRTVGTPAFFAPELCQFVNDEYDFTDEQTMKQQREEASPTKLLQSPKKTGVRMDVWALGVTLYCLFFKSLPFNGDNEYQLFKSITKDNLQWYNEPPKQLVLDAHRRVVYFYDAFREFLQYTLVKDPSARPNVAQLKEHNFATFKFKTEEDKLVFLRFNEQFLPSPPQPLQPIAPPALAALVILPAPTPSFEPPLFPKKEKRSNSFSKEIGDKFRSLVSRTKTSQA
ncbi:hypothetical protein BABINDRAFT_159848 [Babjeviella inositovora NRRL Y-12698]|uniref:Protein kinase domain-containing protein n=1 Tax=Babjeviella inositovora NRRL Y-12698 TaxID=984486 RepID=A0A1E3QV87_9ASCO|nr:uncharacterized protein BABINDRAFT_159848 [Babjeviella inositovora NRRL Y-12698]ODQ81575.1 hypothetical protein BABINDRAFT_159848 [Babjeviella inositovora NRRL Y-12698]